MRRAHVPGLAGIGLLLFAAAPAGAFSFFDGRLEVHGYVSETFRTLGQNLSTGKQWDLSQWYNVANVEIEATPFPNGVGPIEILEFYARAQVGYDCVWTRACGMFPSVNTYGNRAERLPDRLVNGDYAGFTGSLRNGDTRLASNVDRNNYSLAHRDDPQRYHHAPLTVGGLPGVATLFGNARGPNEVFEPLLARLSDDPSTYYFGSYIKHCKFGISNSRGGENGQVFNFIGPWNPDCEIEPIGALRYKANPFSLIDFNPILAGVDGIPNTGDECREPRYANPPEETGCPGDTARPAIVPYGFGELPYRPVPFLSASQGGTAKWQAQGLFAPSPALVREMRNHTLDSIDQNFSQSELAWNRGSSQQDEKELKEAYADIEMFGGRLWLRLGKQTIVWGKTELFRNTDQFNPQDFAMASIPNLEESRIGLWAARGTWSFYNVGKLEDVRLELAANIDDFEPADLGRCGEPYTLEIVCNIGVGYLAHGFSGIGLAGQDKPPAPWDDASGFEVGGRLEWRYKKFSFQLSDFWGYDDFPYPRRISSYERNVDPDTGRTRRFGWHGPCQTGYEPSCLGHPNATRTDAAGDPLRAVDTDDDGVTDAIVDRGSPFWKTGSLIVDPAHTADVLAYHPSNLTGWYLSNVLCGNAGTNVDPRVCGFGGLSDQRGPGPAVSTIANGASALAAGSGNAALSGINQGFLCTLRVGTSETQSAVCGSALRSALVLLSVDPSDCGRELGLMPYPCLVGGVNYGAFSDGGGNPFDSPSANPARRSLGLGAALTPEQEALIGCGPFLQSDCDIDGMDILNAEASVIIQSWPGFDGTTGRVDTYDLRDNSRPGPGTVGFQGGPVATRWEHGQLVQLPGSRGPEDAGYDPLVDGCTGTGPLGCNRGDVVAVDANRDGVIDLTYTRELDAPVLTQPFNGQRFANELAALSFNLLMVFATGNPNPYSDPNRPDLSEFDVFDPYGFGLVNNPASPYFGQPRPGVDASRIDGTTAVACGFYAPQMCENIRGFLSAAGARRNSVRAGGNGAYGRRDFPWQSGGELVLDYDKRNVFGFAFDFDEELTKSNWGVEATWISGQTFIDNDQFDGISHSDTVNLTVSVDRPTFINFLNPGRTFFINTQWFFQYITDYGKNYYVNGPLNVLATLTAFTGYHQDRLMVSATAVYDFNSNSGALLPSVSYRFTESFSTTLGVNVFWGHEQLRQSAINELRPGLNRTGHDAYMDAVQNGLAALRERDEVNLTIRYTF